MPLATLPCARPKLVPCMRMTYQFYRTSSVWLFIFTGILWSHTFPAGEHSSGIFLPRACRGALISVQTEYLLTHSHLHTYSPFDCYRYITVRIAATYCHHLINIKMELASSRQYIFRNLLTDITPNGPCPVLQICFERNPWFTLQ